MGEKVGLRRGFHHWFPTYTPKDDDDDTTLLDYITVSKPIIDDRDPLPLIRRVRDNEHALHVTEINVPQYLRNILDIHLFYGMMMIEDPSNESYRKKTMQIHLNKFLEENGHPAVALDSLMVEYELITPDECPLTTHGFGNTDDKINVTNSITKHKTKEDLDKEQDFVYCHVGVRDASIKYKDKSDRNPISKLRERMLKLQESMSGTSISNPDTTMSS